MKRKVDCVELSVELTLLGLPHTVKGLSLKHGQIAV